MKITLLLGGAWMSNVQRLCRALRYGLLTEELLLARLNASVSFSIAFSIGPSMGFSIGFATLLLAACQVVDLGVRRNLIAASTPLRDLQLRTISDENVVRAESGAGRGLRLAPCGAASCRAIERAAL